MTYRHDCYNPVNTTLDMSNTTSKSIVEHHHHHHYYAPVPVYGMGYTVMSPPPVMPDAPVMDTNGYTIEDIQHCGLPPPLVPLISEITNSYENESTTVHPLMKSGEDFNSIKHTTNVMNECIIGGTVYNVYFYDVNTEKYSTTTLSDNQVGSNVMLGESYYSFSEEDLGKEYVHVLMKTNKEWNDKTGSEIRRKNLEQTVKNFNSSKRKKGIFLDTQVLCESMFPGIFLGIRKDITEKEIKDVRNLVKIKRTEN